MKRADSIENAGALPTFIAKNHTPGSFRPLGTWERISFFRRRHLRRFYPQKVLTRPLTPRTITLMPPSLFVLLHAIKETAKISWPAVQHQRAGTLTVEIGDEKLRSWAQALLHHVDAKLVVSGLEHLNTETRSFVIMSNHQSLYDIPALFAALPLSLRMVAKKELFKTPLWGPAMTAAGFIAIDRKNRKAAFKALKKGGALMKEQGISLFIAPEGTRSADGSVGEFKKGGFVLAQATGAPILPVAISGTMNVLSKGHSQVHRGQTIHVQVLPPTSQPNFKQMDQLIQTVRGQIVAAVSELSSR